MKMIKNILYISLVGLIVGCSSEFMDVENVNELSDQSFYKTASDFEDLLITCYMPMAFSDFFGVQYHVINFAMDDRVLHEQVGTSRLEYDATNNAITNVFRACYTGVYRTNLWLEKIVESNPVINATRRDQMYGEVYFMRAFYYFYLASHFENPPLLLTTPKDPSKGIANSTQEEIYNQVEKDLKDAITLLPTSWPSAELGRATKGSAMALLGKTYMYRAKFDEAAKIFAEIINSGVYELNMPKGTDSLDYVWAYLANFTPINLPAGENVYTSEFNSESIFEINFSDTYDEGDRSSIYLPGRRSTGSHMTWFHGPANITGGFGNVAMEDKNFPLVFETLSSHPAGLTRDPRYYAVFINAGDTLDFRSNHPLNKKVFGLSDLNSAIGSTKGLRKHLYPFNTTFTNPQAPYMDPNNWRVIRYADVLLMYAEAGLRSGTSPASISPLEALNKVRERAGVPQRASLNKNFIMHERDVELAAEHIRFWDLVRWYKDGWLTLDEVKAFKPRFEPKHVCWPIPLSQININFGELKQNPKWLE